MKNFAVAIVLFGVCGLAHAVKPCEELRAEIATKLDEKGVKAYTLEIVENDEVGDATVVGSCDGGTKKIVYTRE